MDLDARATPSVIEAGPYRAVKPLAEGTFASVWTATAAPDDRPVLLKLARRADEEALAAFRAEFAHGTRVRHPHLGEVLDHGIAPDGRPYLVLTAHEGEPLTDRPGPWPAPALAALGLQLARALAAIHDEGLIHRDLSPSNVLVDARGRVRLIDAGMLTESRGATTASLQTLPPSPGATASDAAPTHDAFARRGAGGTPLYMAPEALAGREVDARADLYALGALLYRQATGRAPFEELPVEALVRAALDSPPTPIGERAPQLGAALAGLIMRLLAKEPADRPASAREVAAALHPLADEPPLIGDGRWRPTPAFEGWRATCDQPGAHAFLGEPGLGATRHLREAFRYLRSQGRPAVRLAAEPGDGPFALVERLWRWAAAHADARSAADGLSAAERGTVASLWPWAFPGTAPCEEPDRLAERLRKGLAALLRAAAGGPLTVLVDRWDTADAASRHVLEGLWREPGLAWLLSARHAPKANQGPEGPEPLGLPVPDGTTAWMLQPMDRDAATTWLASCWQLSAPVWLADQLHQASGGNPGWMRLALSRLVRAGALAGPEALPTPLAVPASVEAMLAEQWAQLAPAQRQLLEAVAVYAQPFRPDELGAVEAWLSADWPLQLGALVESGVLGREGEVHRFRHGWWAGWIEARLDPNRRASLACGLARALEARWRPVSDPQRLHRLASLFAQGDDPEPTIRYALDAGQALARVYANQAAQTHFAEGLAAIAAHPDPSRFERERLALTIGQADVQRLTGELAAAAQAYERCLDWVVLPTERARLLVSLGKARQMLNRFEPAKAALEEALALLEGAGAPMERLRALTTLGRVCYFLGDREGSLKRYEAALVIGRAENVPAFAAEALAFLGTLRVARAGSAQQGLADLAEALSIREATGDQLGRNDTHMLLGNALFTMGRYQEAWGHFEANRAIAHQVGHHQEAAFAHLNLALCELELGDWPRAAASLGEARRLARLADDAFLLGLGAALESLARLHLGDMAAMEACLAEAREREAAQANPTLRLHGLLVEAERHLFLGAFEHARRASELAVSLLAHGPENAAKARLLLAEAWLHQGQLGAAREALAQAAGCLDESGAVGPRAQWLRLTGLLAEAEGRRDQARADWAAALTLAEQQGLVHLQAALLLDRHLSLRQDPSATPALAELEQAYALAERLRAPEPLALGCLGLGVRYLEAGQELFAERLFRRGHELLGLFTQALGSPGGRAAFLAHPTRAPYCEVRELTEAHQLQRRSRRLEMLLELGRSLGASRDPAGVLERVRAFTLEVTQAERCLILLATAGEPDLVGEPAPYSRTIVSRVCRELESVCVLDTRADEDLRAQASILDLQVRAVMCVPLMVGGALHGALYVDSRLALGAFTPEDLRCVEAIAKQAAVALDNAQLHQALAEQLQRQDAYIRRLEESEHVIRHLSELDRVRGEYFQAASHDLRAPLASINVSCQALMKGILGPMAEEQHEAIAGIHHGSRSLMAQIDGILDAAKLEAGRLILNAQPVALVKPVREAIRLLRALAVAKGLDLRWDELALAALPPVSGDERRLQQVVLNLLSNAIKFTDRGHVAIAGRVVPLGVELSVADTGRGLPSERQEKLFERYGASEQGAYAGSGLGLWLVKGLVDLHQGRIDVASREGEGTTFRVVLPTTL
jgi:signal transduction histidine kinase/tetratricopeptide (TPR) repeat protein